MDFPGVYVTFLVLFVDYSGCLEGLWRGFTIFCLRKKIFESEIGPISVGGVPGGPQPAKWWSRDAKNDENLENFDFSIP